MTESERVYTCGHSAHYEEAEEAPKDLLRTEAHSCTALAFGLIQLYSVDTARFYCSS